MTGRYRTFWLGHILTYLRLFFVWLDDTSYGKWEAPRKLLKPFKVRIDDLRTTKELREIKQIDQFDIRTLVSAKNPQD